MILLYISIPLMILGVAIATLPLFAAMRVESRIERSRTRVARLEPAVADETPLAA